MGHIFVTHNAAQLNKFATVESEFVLFKADCVWTVRQPERQKQEVGYYLCYIFSDCAENCGWSVEKST